MRKIATKCYHYTIVIQIIEKLQIAEKNYNIFEISVQNNPRTVKNR